MAQDALQKALAKVTEMSAEDQDRVGRRLNAYLENLETLRTQLDEGVRSLEDGRGKALDIEQVIARARKHEV